EQPAAPPLPKGWSDPLQQIPFQRTQNPMATPDYYTYGQSGGEHQFFTDNQLPQKQMADGGDVQGPGSGRSDDIEALLSDGEYVIDAESVALLGDGSLDEGSRRLDQMRANLRRH